jgi:hypothetical protein
MPPFGGKFQPLRRQAAAKKNPYELTQRSGRAVVVATHEKRVSMDSIYTHFAMLSTIHIITDRGFGGINASRHNG